MSEQKKVIVKLTESIPVKKKGGGVVQTNEIEFPSVLKVKHLKKLPKSFFEKEGQNLTPAETAPILTALTGLSVSSIDELTLDDMIKCIEVIGDLVGKTSSPEIGK